MVYFWLLRFFPVRAVVPCTLTAFVVCCGDVDDLIQYYTFDGILWAICSGFCACLSLETSRPGKRLLFIALSGVFAALSFLSKQTIGLGVTLAVPFVLVALKLRIDDIRSAARYAGGFICGWIPPVALCWLWLARNHALWPYFDQVFIRGGSSKGPLVSTLLRPVLQPLTDHRLLPCFAMALLAVAVAAIAWNRKRNSLPPIPERHLKMDFALMVLAVIGGVWIVFKITLVQHWRFTNLVSSEAALMTCGMIFAAGCLRLSGAQPSLREAQLWLIAGVSLAIAYMCFLSYAIYEAPALPALALALSLAWANLENLHGRYGRWAIQAICTLLLVAGIRFKLTVPFYWGGAGGWQEPPVSEAITKSALPELGGLRLSPRTVSMAEHLTQVIQANSRPEDDVLVYSHMPIFYILTHRRPCTFSYVFYHDVCPDYIAIEDAQRIRQHPPQMVVLNIPLDRNDYDDMERVFRGGKRSGQREMVKALGELRPRYQVIEQAGQFEVWVLKGGAAK